MRWEFGDGGAGIGAALSAFAAWIGGFWCIGLDFGLPFDLGNTPTTSSSSTSTSSHSSSSSTARGGMTRGGMTYMLWVPKQFVELIFLLFFCNCRKQT